MSADQIFLALGLTVLALIILTTLILLFIKRGLSSKYQRVSKDVRPTNPWSALSAGEDPTA